ncbi:MAG TPA: hypothetical protein VHY20_02715 [Pirellulales bacterium]|nr:hypothetical protein [Pirellulales bacterium]
MNSISAACDPATPTRGPNVASAGLGISDPAQRVSHRRSWLAGAWVAARSVSEWLLGLSTIVVGLALVATVPVLQMLSLGYLLEASARVVKSGRLSSGLVGVRPAARLGGIVLGCWLVLLPVRLIGSLATSAQLVDPGGPTQRAWLVAWAVAVVLATLHLIGAVARGGRLRHFFWPAPVRVARLLLRRGALAKARDAIWNFTAGMRLGYFFWLGLRGFIGGLLWLLLPVALISATPRVPALGLVGSLLLACVVLYLPFAQTRFAAENRFAALLEVRPLRSWFRFAPWALTAALGATLALSLPLYVFKIELLPRDAAWIPSLFFIAMALPSRLLVGWACGYAQRRPRMRNWFSRQAARLASLSLALAYVLIVYFTQYTSWYGLASLYEQHAFLLPAPFLNY